MVHATLRRLRNIMQTIQTINILTRSYIQKNDMFEAERVSVFAIAQPKLRVFLLTEMNSIRALIDCIRNDNQTICSNSKGEPCLCMCMCVCVIAGRRSFRLHYSNTCRFSFLSSASGRWIWNWIQFLNGIVSMHEIVASIVWLRVVSCRAKLLLIFYHWIICTIEQLPISLFIVCMSFGMGLSQVTCTVRCLFACLLCFPCAVCCSL